MSLFNVNNYEKKIFIVNNFYSNPFAVREFALSEVEYEEDLRYYKGLRSKQPYRPEGLKYVFERIIGERISVWDEYNYNGVFQITRSSDPQVYHYDIQHWAAIIYLSPSIPLQSGTRTHKSILNGSTHRNDSNVDQAFNSDFYDSTKWDVVDNIGGVFNRLIIMDAQTVHSAGPYFGNDKTSGRLTHLFFFD